MLLCGNEILLPLIFPLLLPSTAPAASAAIVDSAVAVALIFVDIHHLPTVGTAFLFGTLRWAWSVVAAPIAALAEGSKEVNFPDVDLHLC
jgi:hypothetical protein